MFISTIFGDLGDLLVMVRRPKGVLKNFPGAQPCVRKSYKVN